MEQLFIKMKLSEHKRQILLILKSFNSLNNLKPLKQKV